MSQVDIEKVLSEGIHEVTSSLQNTRARLVAELAQVEAKRQELQGALRRIDRLMTQASPDSVVKRRNRSGTSQAGKAEKPPPLWRMEAVENLLRERGEMRTRNIAEALGWNQNYTSHILRIMRRQERIRLSGYVADVKGRVPLFALMDEEGSHGNS